MNTLLIILGVVAVLGALFAGGLHWACRKYEELERIFKGDDEWWL